MLKEDGWAAVVLIHKTDHNVQDIKKHRLRQPTGMKLRICMDFHGEHFCSLLTDPDTRGFKIERC